MEGHGCRVGGVWQDRGAAEGWLRPSNGGGRCPMRPRRSHEDKSGGVVAGQIDTYDVSTILQLDKQKK